MKFPTRILLPVIAAVLVTGGILGFLWYQMNNTSSELQKKLQGIGGVDSTPLPSALDDTPIGAGDEALLSLRQGDLLALQGNWKDAEDQYQKAVREGGGVTALRKLAQAQLQRRETDGVRTTMVKLKSAGARAEDLLLLEAILDIRSGELSKAQDVINGGGESPQRHYAQALLFLVQADHENAKKELALVIGGWDPVLRSYAKVLQDAYDEYALFPDSPNIHLVTLLARALAETQQCELALPLLTQVVSQQDDYRDAWIVKGFCELTTERDETALASLERAYNLDPEKPETQYFLARAHAALNDHQNAITFAQYALKNGFQPEKEVHAFLAREAVKANDQGLALQQYKALAADKDATLADEATVVSVALALQNNDEALAAATTATTKWPTDGKAFELLGSVYEKMSDTEKAKAAYEQALQLDPSLPGIQEKIDN